ncbi:STYL1 protein, partial [Pitta sordida]|nr:STYL1 protein [Pitta sordida]
MAGLALCLPRQLYNIINQYRRYPRLTEPNYLCLLDARTEREFEESHIITARRIERSPAGQYLIPNPADLRYFRYCVVYDSSTSSLDSSGHDEEEKERDGGTEPALANSFLVSLGTEQGTSVLHARNFEQFTRSPVLILKGGYRRFSACYPFLGTQKILWMPRELDNYQPYPAEILPAKLYMGNFKQASDQKMQKDLKIKALVNVSEQPATLFSGGESLHISVPDTLEADLFSSFPTISHFIDAHVGDGAVLVLSSLGTSRSSTAIMAYLMHSCHFSLQRAWDHLLECKATMRPHRGFVKQLSAWETQIHGSTITDISEPNY